MKIIYVIFSAILVFITSCNTLQNEQKKTILSFLQELKKSASSHDLYDKYFYYGKTGEKGRSLKDIKIYKDSIFFDIKKKVGASKVEVLSLVEVKKKYPHQSFYSNYYEGQSNNIYICFPSQSSVDNATYFLMYGNKIVSTLPIATLEGKIIEWY